MNQMAEFIAKQVMANAIFQFIKINLYYQFRVITYGFLTKFIETEIAAYYSNLKPT